MNLGLISNSLYIVLNTTTAVGIKLKVNGFECENYVRLIIIGLLFCKPLCCVSAG